LKSVTLYGRAECQLCTEAEVLLTRLQREIRFSIQVVDIDNDMEAHNRYWLRIPVVLVDGDEVASAPIDELELSRALKN
jgi:glutaredoxin